jgi:hypothetical protein
MPRCFAILPAFVLVATALLGWPSPAGASQPDIVEGRLDIVWGDPPPGTRGPSPTVLIVTEDDGRRTEVAISPELAASHGGFLAWNRKRIRVHLAPESPERTSDLRPGTRRVLALTLLEDGDGASNRGSVTGSDPWVSILCKFADIDAEPRDLAYFENMYANSFGGLDDYWRKQSYGKIDIAGSVAVDWVELPGNQTDYVPDPGNDFDADLNALFEDCTDAADPFVDFSNGGSGGYSGINQMFNDLLDCCAWGGSLFATLDGVTKSWRVSWNPPWAFANSAIIAHEMGHGFGLPHNTNFDNDGNPYDSPWDVMSWATGYAVNDSTYGALGKHHTAYHKNSLGWFEPAEVLTVSDDETVTATIDAMALSTTPNYRMARIPIAGSDDWYTVEARDALGYDGAIVDKAVIISHVDTGRIEPAWAVDIASPPADDGDNEGTMFKVGETFEDMGNEISISVDSETTHGFIVTISTQATLPIFRDRFEILMR